MENEPRQDLRDAVRRLIAIDVVAIGAMLAVSAWAWTKISAGQLIPIHWASRGSPMAS